MEPESFYSNSIFWVEIDRVNPNPYQPRKEFDDARLSDLAESIRQYGILQPLVVTRHEEIKDGTGLSVLYELIAGERRLRAAKIAGLSQVPVIIRNGEEQNKVKLELAIVENLQREDLNPIDRATAFNQLVEEFGYKHGEVAKKLGKSREYVSNTIRLLAVPDEVQDAIRMGKITEGHARSLLMLSDKPEEQDTLFKEVLLKKLTVRETEGIARRIAFDKVRKRRGLNVEIIELERKLTETLGTRVHIEEKEVGGKVTIDYFSQDDLRGFIELLQRKKEEEKNKKKGFLNSLIPSSKNEVEVVESEGKESNPPTSEAVTDSVEGSVIEESTTDTKQYIEGEEKISDSNESVEENPPEKIAEEDDDELYSVKNFSV